MRKTNNMDSVKPEQNKANPEMFAWLSQIDKLSLVSSFNKHRILETLEAADERDKIIPFVLTLCPAIKNLESPNKKGQTRELVPLTKENPRLQSFIKELVSFLIVTKKQTGLNSDIFLIFSDSLEKHAEKMFVNSDEIKEITKESLRGVREAFFEFDQENPGLFQTQNIRIPKIKAQTDLPGWQKREKLISNFEFKMLDPSKPHFETWLKHLKNTREDESFVKTGWQNKKGAEAIWSRVRFLLSEFMTDGTFLPEVMKKTKKARFLKGMPDPIFFASTTRVTGIEMEADGFVNNGLIPAFSNIGRWLEPPRKSPWIEILDTDIINK